MEVSQFTNKYTFYFVVCKHIIELIKPIWMSIHEYALHSSDLRSRIWDVNAFKTVNEANKV